MDHILGLCIKPGIQEREQNARNAGNQGNIIFGGMSPSIPGNVENMLGNVLKHSGECRQTFRGMSPNIPRNALNHSLLLTNDNIKSKALKVDGRMHKLATQIYFIVCS